MGIITFNGVASSAYGIVVESCPSYAAAPRKVEYISVEGRNGDLIRDTGAYANIEQTYDVWFADSGKTFQELSSAVAMWLLGSTGYCRLEDDYFPDIYRMACYSQLIENKNFLNRKGRATLVFNCKPQRFLKTGETQTLVTGNTLTNDYMPCFPIFSCTNNGSVTVDDYTFTISNNPGTLYIDTETQDAWVGSATMNEELFLGGGILNSLNATWSPFCPARYMALTNYYLAYELNTWQGSVSGILEFKGNTSASYSIVVDSSTTVVVSHTANVLSNTFTWSSGNTVGAKATLYSRLNCNSCVSGDIVGVPHGGCSIAKSNPSMVINWTPRWWVL